MVSKDNSINSNSNILFKSPPRFPAIDIKAKMLIERPKTALFFIILLQKELIPFSLDHLNWFNQKGTKVFN